jgi:hypothetical protein
MVEAKRITAKMAEAKQEAADREAALTAQVGRLAPHQLCAHKNESCLMP